MARYFLEVAYKGTHYSGFQAQENANTVQAEIEKAFHTLHRVAVQLTGSSRTDAGVHAFQNYFHFDFEAAIHPEVPYKLNAILPNDIAVRGIYAMPAEAHARFDATSREYFYKIHRFKDPFLTGASLYYPYKLNLEAMKEGASYLATQQNFFAFSKTNTQVKTFNCTIRKSEWSQQGDQMIYTIEYNRFLRGMVRLVTATLLRLGRDRISIKNFRELFQPTEKAGHSVPPHGLYLKHVHFLPGYFRSGSEH